MRTVNRDRALLAVLGLVVVAMVVTMLRGGGMLGSGWGHNGATHMGGWSWGPAMTFGLLGMLVLFGVVIAGGYVLSRRAADRRIAGWGARTDDPQAILRQRYAAGEIDQAAFERMQRETKV